MEAVAKDDVKSVHEGVLDEAGEVVVVELREELHRIQDEDLVNCGQLDDGGRFSAAEG